MAFFYCANESNDRDDFPASVASARRSTVHILRAILAQCAVLADGSISKPVKDAFSDSIRKGPGESNLSIKDVLEILNKVLSTRDSQLTLVFDALDELQDQDNFFKTIKTLCALNNRVRILLSSRPLVDVVAELPERDVIVIPVQSLNAYDIRFFVGHEINKRLPKAGRSLGPEDMQALQELADRLRRALEKWSEGVYVRLPSIGETS